MQAWLMKEVSGVGQTFALGLWLATLEVGLHMGEMTPKCAYLAKPFYNLLCMS